MRSVGAIAGPTLLAAAVVGGLGTASSATATDDGALNGTYLATSNGEWAQTNDSYHDEATVRSTWTITSTCTTPQDCAGRVTSDAGWSADLRRSNVEWTVKRDIPNWEPCADGTAYTGAQVYRFYSADASGGQTSLGSTTLIGEDKTTGPSGACGRNQWLTVRMPFKLVKIA
ncbi:MAG TPA: hypothetical protein VKI00_16200 [Mycobacterium sp.]|uniref:hypothetical protein n=1 Tax=Mycobacterium sp. TaxID=1785 RepID=UPI002B5CCB48|nr:hypothetical protein [Mycobacterium sp.]HME77125.1 hypothetical protein [Mycobacterium sp.]